MSSAKPTILHMLTAAPNLSPFDVNMAIDAGWQHCIPYTSIAVDQVQAYTQDAIFSRGPKGVKHTGLFIGGRDIHLAMDMLEAARESMVPPFEVSVFADPSGAFTTAAGMVACAEKHLRASKDLRLKGRRTLVFGGTGPVGSTCAVLAAKAGAHVAIVSHAGAGRAREAAEMCSRRYGVAGRRRRRQQRCGHSGADGGGRGGVRRRGRRRAGAVRAPSPGRGTSRRGLRRQRGAAGGDRRRRRHE